METKGQTKKLTLLHLRIIDNRFTRVFQVSTIEEWLNKCMQTIIVNAHKTLQITYIDIEVNIH